MSCMSLKGNLLLHFLDFLLELRSLIPISVIFVGWDRPFLLAVPSQFLLAVPSQFLTLDQQLYYNLLLLALQHISDQLVHPVNSVPSQISAVHHAQGLVLVDGLLQGVKGVCQPFEPSSIDLQHLLIHLNQLLQYDITQGTMGGGMCCPNAQEPPTREHAKCTKILMGLAIYLLPLSILGLVTGDTTYIFQFFMSLFLIFFLFMAWRTFSWCIVLMFIFYSMVFLLQSVVYLVGYIQYKDLFTSKYLWQSIYIVAACVYYVVAIPLSHYCYRIFKSYSAHPFLVQPMRPQEDRDEGRPQPNEQIQRQGLFGRNMMNNENNQDNRNNPRNNRNNNNNINPFAGQGVRIG